MRRCLLGFLFVLVAESASDKGFPDYNAQVYPDSQIDFGLCRLIEPSLACDPNALLNSIDGRDGVILLHEATQQVLFHTKCVCDSVTYGTCIHKTRGYPISVVVLRKIRGSSNRQDNPPELAEAFAKVLRRRLKRGQCDDDTLIVYSVDDAQVFTVVGSMARRKLDVQLVSEVENLARVKHFDNGNHTAGLLLMVDIFKQVFLGQHVNVALLPVNDSGLQSLSSKWPTWMVILVLAGIPVLVMICILAFAGFFAFRRYYQRRAQGYEAGRPRREA